MTEENDGRGIQSKSRRDILIRGTQAAVAVTVVPKVRAASAALGLEDKGEKPPTTNLSGELEALDENTHQLTIPLPEDLVGDNGNVVGAGENLVVAIQINDSDSQIITAVHPADLLGFTNDTQTSISPLTTSSQEFKGDALVRQSGAEPADEATEQALADTHVVTQRVHNGLFAVTAQLPNQDLTFNVNGNQVTTNPARKLSVRFHHDFELTGPIPGLKVTVNLTNENGTANVQSTFTPDQEGLTNTSADSRNNPGTGHRNKQD